MRWRKRIESDRDARDVAESAPLSGIARSALGRSNAKCGPERQLETML